MFKLSCQLDHHPKLPFILSYSSLRCSARCFEFAIGHLLESIVLLLPFCNIVEYQCDGGTKHLIRMHYFTYFSQPTSVLQSTFQKYKLIQCLPLSNLIILTVKLFVNPASSVSDSTFPTLPWNSPGPHFPCSL